jgi:aminoglycoside phosphotransferase (APT) family kinase protein
MKPAATLGYWAFAKGRILKAKYEQVFHSPERLIDATIEKAVGSPAVGKVKITKGITNQVSSVTLANGDEVIVRISRRDKSRFGTERWAIEQCAKARVPVPRVVFVETIEHEGKPLNISIESKIQGTPLDELARENISEERLAELLRKTGDVLSKIHSIRTNGFGDLDEGGNGKYEFAGDMLSEKELNEDQFIKVARAVYLDPEIVKRSLELLFEYSVKCPVISPHLIHNDFTPRHVMVVGDEISGILDFELAQGGDPVLELAKWQYFFEDRFPLRYLLAGYDNSGAFGEEFEKRVHIWKLYIGLIHLSSYADKYRNGIPEWIERCKIRLTEAVAYFSQASELKRD